MKITEQLKIFSFYIGQDVLIPTYGRAKLVGVRIHPNGNAFYTYAKNQTNAVLEWYSNEAIIEDTKLLLKDLCDITDPEIFELCKLASPNEFGDFRYSKWKITQDNANELHPKYIWNSVKISNKKAEHFFFLDKIDGMLRLYNSFTNNHILMQRECVYQQWYFDQGYAVPIYPWNENPFTLGIALNTLDVAVEKC